MVLDEIRNCGLHGHEHAGRFISLQERAHVPRKHRLVFVEVVLVTGKARVIIVVVIL